MKRANQAWANALLGALALAILVMCAPARAYGYVDPGSGSFVYQAVYAVFIGGVFYFRKLMNKFRGKNRNPNR